MTAAMGMSEVDLQQKRCGITRGASRFVHPGLTYLAGLLRGRAFLRFSGIDALYDWLVPGAADSVVTAGDAF
jgi:hypothetical protein